MSIAAAPIALDAAANFDKSVSAVYIDRREIIS